jgi:hypothetical protein
MTGKHNAVVARIKQVSHDARSVYYGIHLEALADRKLPAILKTVVTEAVKIVNFIKSRATISRLFWILCNAVGRQHDKLLHTEVRWLSRAKALSRQL